MAFTIKEADVVADASYSGRPSTMMTADGKIYGSVGPFSASSAGIHILPHIFVQAEAQVGELSEAMLKRTDWSFGFIQCVSLGQFFAVYSGAKSNAGSIIVRTLEDSGRAYPDYESSRRGDAARPWTRTRSERFTYDAGKKSIRATSDDGPAFSIPSVLRNQMTSADNYIEEVVDARRICCAFVVEEAGQTPKRRILSHSMWDIRLAFAYKWRKGKIVPTTRGTVSVSDFKFGAPTDPDLAKFMEDSFLTRTSYNELATAEIDRTFRAIKSDKKKESDTWTLGTPKDFYVP